MQAWTAFVHDQIYSIWTAIWALKVCALLCVLALVSTRGFTHRSCQIALRKTDEGREPPLAPYTVPFVGHLITFLRDPAGLCLSVSNHVGPGIPCRVKLFLQDVYIISQPSVINLLWAKSEDFTPKEVQLIGMRNILKLNPSGFDFCKLDDSGRGPRPHPESTVNPDHRIWYHTHNSAATFLSGPHLENLVLCFQQHLKMRIDVLLLDHQWSHEPDFYRFLYDILFPTQVDVLFGQSFLLLNPAFPSDFRVFHRGLPYLLRGYPRWLVRRAWDARERCLASIKKWHVFVKDQEDKGKLARDEERLLFYGSDFIRNRRQMHSKMRPLDEDAIASSELGVIWAANSNIISAVFWYMIELAKNSELLSQILAEVSASTHRTHGMEANLDAKVLSTQPRIQSCYAEILRLHTYNFLVTTSEHRDANFRSWTFPKDKMVAISSHTAHMDTRTWSTGSNDTDHPLNAFWAERFLRYDFDSRTHPLSTSYSLTHKQHKHPDERHDVFAEQLPTPKKTPALVESPKFSLGGLSGIWIPFGGGYSLCPGRFIAKEEILLAVATLSTRLEVELVDGKGSWETFMNRLGISGEEYQRDVRYFGMGILPPSRRVEVRVRRRLTYPRE